jgi:hypothetical protein
MYLSHLQNTFNSPDQISQMNIFLEAWNWVKCLLIAVFQFVLPTKFLSVQRPYTLSDDILRSIFGFSMRRERQQQRLVSRFFHRFIDANFKRVIDSGDICVTFTNISRNKCGRSRDSVAVIIGGLPW